MAVSHVARKLGVSESTYRDWENGRQIKGEPYMKIANLFGVSLSELFLGEEGNMQAIVKDIHRIEAIIQSLKIKL